MRSLDECKAEVFRRSEIKIKKRRKTRNRILAVCIPLCLCIGIGGAASGGLGAKSEDMAAAPESAYMSNGAAWLAEEAVGADAHTTAADSTRPVGGVVEQEAPGDPAGTTQTITLNGDPYLIGQEDHEVLKDILQNLEYSPHKVCRCLPQYRLETDFGSYGIHLSEGYARCDDGQADLTEEQTQTLRQLFDTLTE